MKAVDGEILAVKSEDFSDAFPPSNPDECRIGNIHRTVAVLAHQLAHSSNVADVEWQELPVNQTLDSASAKMRVFVPTAPPPPPVGSPSTYYIDCSGGYYTNTVSCQATPDNTNSNDLYASQQAGYAVGTAIQAWRVKHHNETVARQAREALVFYQSTYLRDRLTFLGSDLVEPKRKVQGGIVIFRRTDRVRPNGPFTVHVPISEPGTGMERVLTFQFVDKP